jgi:TPR repeat protein
LERLQKAAEAGNMDAQFDLGRRYYAGLGLGKDNQKAFEWFQKAANQGHVEAQGSVGLMYYLGWGVIRNRDKGCQALHYSAQRGSSIGITFYNKHCNPD